MNLRALSDHVIIMRDPVEQVTECGIALPPAKNPHKGLEFGTVMEVGPGPNPPVVRGYGYSQAVKRGDRVLFLAKKAVPIKTEDKSDLVVMREDDIVAIVE